MKFSQRIGSTPAAKLAQRETIDQELRASLWSVVTLFYWEPAKDEYGEKLNSSDETASSTVRDLVVRLWLYYFKKPTDEIDQYWGSCLAKLRTYYFNAKWFEVYDFIEFIAQNGPEETKKTFIKFCNDFLEQENSAYRFVDEQIAEVTSQVEIESVEAALHAAAPYAGVTRHLESALSLMADRKNPDYRNSIKESISAVESLAKHIAKDPSATLGVVLKELERRRTLHPALKSAFSSLYGYTSDTQGIRHALLDEPTLTKTDARFMLVCCSAFVNYVVDAVANP
jgi:hypothetical protein